MMTEDQKLDSNTSTPSSSSLSQKDEMNNQNAKKLSEKIKELEKQKKELLEELRTLKKKPEGKIAYLLLNTGFILILFAMIFSHFIIAFISISLIFWGALLLFIRPKRFIHKDVLDSSVADSIKDVHIIVDKLGYKGKPTYFSSRSLPGFHTSMLYIPKSDSIPQKEIIQNLNLIREENVLISPSFIGLMPPGLGLHRIIEKELKINFSTVNLGYIKDNLEKALVEGFEIIEDFIMNVSDISIKVYLKNNVFYEIIEEINEQDQYIGDPLTSALACIFTRSTHLPIVIDKLERDQQNKSTEIIFKFVDEDK